jgi:hypothetical protein
MIRMKLRLPRAVHAAAVALAILAPVGAASCASKSPPAASADDALPARHASDAPASAAASAANDSSPSVSAAPAASDVRKASGEVLLGEIEAPKQFNPKPTLEGLKSKFEGCFKTALALDASVHGRLKVRFVVEESGKVSSSEDAGGSSLKDTTLIACVNDAIKTATFPKPGGTATVMFPLSFR